MRLALLALLASPFFVACAGEVDETGAGDTADTDPGVDTDDTDEPGDEAPCPGVVEVLDLSAGPVATSSELTTDDPMRATGQGDYPSELFAVKLEDTPTLRISVRYPEPELATSGQYWMKILWMDADCGLHPVNTSAGGDATHDQVEADFTPPEAGWWHPMLYFPEAMIQPGEVPYTLELSRVEE